MNKRFREYGKAEVFKNKSLLNQFLKEYKQYFGEKPEPSCSKCRTEYWNNYINLISNTMGAKKCKWELKLKYNGITMSDKVPILNSEMTDEKALELYYWHPAHELLFEVMPKRIPAEPEVDVIPITPDKELTIYELRKKYPKIKANSKTEFLKKLK